MEIKDAILGIALIAVVGLAGGVGYLVLTYPSSAPTEEVNLVVNPNITWDITWQYNITQPQPETQYLSGLPDSWATAPNSTYIMFYNQTGAVIKVNLSNILDGVALYNEHIVEYQATGREINMYKKMIYLYTIRDPVTNIYITGVDPLDILEKYDTNFGWDLQFLTEEFLYKGQKIREHVNTTTGYLMSNTYAKTPRPVIIALAANKTWLNESPFSSWGDFALTDEFNYISLHNLEQVKVLSNWSIDVSFNGAVMKLDSYNLTQNPFIANYFYYRSDYYNYDRQFWGVNISQILAYNSSTTAATNYKVRFYCVDDFWYPSNKGEYKDPNPYNKTEVEQGNIIYNRTKYDMVNNSVYGVYDGVPVNRSHLKMILVWMDQEWGEWGPETIPPEDRVQDEIWPYPKVCGYASGPFKVVIPGRVMGNYPKWIYKIEVTQIA